MDEKERIEKALGIAFQYGQTDGSHHRLWVIDQMVRTLCGDNYEEWVKTYQFDEDTKEEYEWDTGIAP